MTDAPERPDPHARAAHAYWRLWRRNWRPPFASDDLPVPDNSGVSPASAPAPSATDGAGATTPEAPGS